MASDAAKLHGGQAADVGVRLRSERVEGSTVERGVRIRPLTPADLDPLRWVIYRAYYETLIELYGPDSASQYEVRSLDFMRLYLRRDSAGSFVAETEDGSLAGGLFCFVWGEVGWFGSLAVAPELQGRGIAQRLTLEAIDYLRARGCRRVGLETWPTAERTRHLYTKLGFLPGRATIKLSRQLQAHSPSPSRMTWVRAGEPEALAAALDDVASITHAIHASHGETEPAADYRSEVSVPVSSGFAELGVLRHAGNEPKAFALTFIRKPSGAAVGALDVRLMLVAPQDDETTLEEVLGALESRAAQIGARSVTCDVNLRYSRAATLLRQRGFHPIYELIRMELPTDGFDPTARSQSLEYARWAG